MEHGFNKERMEAMQQQVDELADRFVSNVKNRMLAPEFKVQDVASLVSDVLSNFRLFTYNEVERAMGQVDVNHLAQVIAAGITKIMKEGN